MKLTLIAFLLSCPACSLPSGARRALRRAVSTRLPTPASHCSKLHGVGRRQAGQKLQPSSVGTRCQGQIVGTAAIHLSRR
jgi:hypothetical protein